MTYDAQLARHLEPDAGPDHVDGLCTCVECDEIARDEAGERLGDGWRDDV